MTHCCSNPPYSKSSHGPAKVEDLAMDEFIKGMQDLKLKFAMLEEKG